LVANSVTENLSERQDVGGVMLYHTTHNSYPCRARRSTNGRCATKADPAFATQRQALADLLADTTDSAYRPNLNAL
jgi:hypothetical protein